MEISTGAVDSALLAVFYPAVCLDDKFGPGCVFFRVDAAGNPIPKYRLYPFAWVTQGGEDQKDSPYK